MDPNNFLVTIKWFSGTYCPPFKGCTNTSVLQHISALAWATMGSQEGIDSKCNSILSITDSQFFMKVGTKTKHLQSESKPVRIAPSHSEWNWLNRVMQFLNNTQCIQVAHIQDTFDLPQSVLCYWTSNRTNTIKQSHCQPSSMRTLWRKAQP